MNSQEQPFLRVRDLEVIYTSGKGRSRRQRHIL